MKKNKNKPPKNSEILSDYEVEIVSQAFKKILGVSTSKKAKKLGVDFEATIRFHSLAHKIRERRESLKLTIKDVSQELKVPQYKLNYIEKGSVSNLNHKILQDYLEFLELNDWYKEWLEANPQFKPNQ